MTTHIVDLEALRIQQEFYQIEEGARVDALRREREGERAACAELLRAAATEQRDEAKRLLSEGNWLPVDRMQHNFAADLLERLVAAIEARK